MHFKTTFFFDEIYSTYTKRRSASETAIEFALLLFYYFNRYEPTYKSQHIKLLDIIAACNKLNVNALNLILITVFSWGRSHRLYLIESKFLIAGT